MKEEYIVEGKRDTGGPGSAGNTGDGDTKETETGKTVRMTHHTERVSFPKDRKKAKAYFKNLQGMYSRCWCVNRVRDTYKSELKFYQEHYAAMVEDRNKTYAQTRHTERMLTIQDIHGRKRTCPEELSIQAGGKKGEGIPERDVFVECIMKYLFWMQEWNQGHGDHMHVLNIHISLEAPYRAVIRRVWDCAGKGGLTKVSMTGALREAGIPYPDQDAEESRYNNRKMTFDRISREALRGCFESVGIHINREPVIYTLRQALKVKEGTDAAERYAKDMLRQIVEIEEQAFFLDGGGDMPGVLKDPDGGVQVPEEGYRILKIRKGLGGAYASRAEQAGKELLAALKEEREGERICIVQEGVRKDLELEYAALRTGLLRCGYYAGNGRGDGKE